MCHLDKRHVVVPTMPGSAFKVVHADIPLCLGKYLFNSVALTRTADGGHQGGSRREVTQIEMLITAGVHRVE